SPAVDPGAEQDGADPLLLPDPVGEIPERRRGSLHLDHRDAAVLVADDEVLLGRRRGSLLALLATYALELGPQLVCLVRASVQERVRLAGRDRFDPPRAGPDRALGQDRERPDLRRPTDVCAAAELHRKTGDLDHAHLVAVLLAEEHRRAELPRLGDRYD